jgi:hypothetical protein
MYLFTMAAPLWEDIIFLSMPPGFLTNARGFVNEPEDLSPA